MAELQKEVGELFRLLDSDSLATLSATDKRVAVRAVRQQCADLFPAINRMMYETQCDPQAVVTYRAVLRDLVARTEAYEADLDYADWLRYSSSQCFTTLVVTTDGSVLWVVFASLLALQHITAAGGID